MENDINEHQGVHYLQFLKQVHSSFNPMYYLEVGTSVGHSLATSSCDSIAIDPNFSFSSNPCAGRRRTLLFQQTSDSFFQNENVFEFFPHVDIAFLDGLHLFEFLLRDFIHLEPYTKKNSIIFMHDCLPLNENMAGRSGCGNELSENDPYKSWWTGDVWKICYVLKELRPDISMTILDCPPTGLLALTNLDPLSKGLSENYFDIVRNYMSLDKKEDWLGSLHRDFPSVSSREILRYPNLFERFWI